MTWVEYDEKEHKRGRVPQCSRPGCVATPTHTRFVERVRMGETKTVRHAFCDEHTSEEREKETAST